ncbi:MAG: hypothetical protein M3Q98_02080 [Actinomycetota bacterium]|nr:hypothetical protein [Actinomycetota bacterium]
MTPTSAHPIENELMAPHVARDEDTQEWAPDWLDQETENRKRLIRM